MYFNLEIEKKYGITLDKEMLEAQKWLEILENYLMVSKKYASEWAYEHTLAIEEIGAIEVALENEKDYKNLIYLK